MRRTYDVSDLSAAARLSRKRGTLEAVALGLAGGRHDRDLHLQISAHDELLLLIGLDQAQVQDLLRHLIARLEAEIARLEAAEASRPPPP
jgi:DNA-binding FrmR family transcriptional regulator